MPQRSVREQLIEHAEDVFRQQGFSAASVQDLTVAARVPKGSFYNHFASKQDLAREILTRYVRATDTSMLADEGLPARERIRRHFAGQVERTMRTGLEFGCLLGTLSAESPAAGQGSPRRGGRRIRPVGRRRGGSHRGGPALRRDPGPAPNLPGWRAPSSTGSRARRCARRRPARRGRSTTS